MRTISMEQAIDLIKSRNSCSIEGQYIYAFRENTLVLYIGKSNNIAARFYEHLGGDKQHYGSALGAFYKQYEDQ